MQPVDLQVRKHSEPPTTSALPFHADWATLLVCKAHTQLKHTLARAACLWELPATFTLLCAGCLVTLALKHLLLCTAQCGTCTSLLLLYKRGC